MILLNLKKFLKEFMGNLKKFFRAAQFLYVYYRAGKRLC